MKLLALISICTLLFISCKKTGMNDNSDLDYNSLVGTWELESTYSGMSPLKTYPEGNGQEISFDSAKYIKRGLVVEIGTYKLIKVSSDTVLCGEYKGHNIQQIFFSNTPVSSKQYILLTGNKLKLIGGCIQLDGGYYDFTKRSNLFY